MCGIAGWYRRDGEAVPPAVIDAQCAVLRHRGPDDQGVLVDGNFGFGMRRLSVVDIVGGHQPMTSRDGRFSIVYNGEIYNFAALRQELEGLGHHFRTQSDTEVILEAFCAWRAATWLRLDGMFGVAIWDHAERRVHLARDPLGIKPLFWTLQAGALAFASELKSLTPVPGLRFEPCAQAIDQYMALGLVCAPRSIYAAVQKLEPGCTLTLSAHGEPRIERYWQLRLHARDDVSEHDWIDECRARLLDTVERHLVADVPLGAFLSGGVDSSAVVAAMSRLTDTPVRTFTIGFDDPRFDESPTAAAIAGHLGCAHLSRKLVPSDADDILPRLAAAFDEPFADSSAIPTWHVSQLAREQVTVALSGDGGDELFAGYRRHRSEVALARLKRVPGAQFALAGAQALQDFPGGLWRRQRAHVAKVAGASRLTSTFTRSVAKQCMADDATRHALYTADFCARLPGGDALSRWADELFGTATPGDPLDDMLYADTTVWLPDDMLTKVDRASMAHSLEVRVPLLSPRFVEWTATVPREFKLQRGVGKALLRKAIAPWLPEGTLDRPKQGFSVPLAAWMAGDLAASLRKAWHDAGLADAGIFVPDALERLLAEHCNGAADHAPRLYGLLMLALWWRQRPGQLPLPPTHATG